MINFLHSLFHDPSKGWDPVNRGWAEQYARTQYGFSSETSSLVARIEELVGGVGGKRVLDLGGGPGQYSAEFAKRGALVTWHDVSRTYLHLAREHAESRTVEVSFSLGYLEDARRFLDRPFDLVFSRLAWCYSFNDARFARLVFNLVQPGGYGYIISNTEAFELARTRPALRRKIIYALNRYAGVKIGHPHPPRGRIEALLRSCRPEYVAGDYSSPDTDAIIFKTAEKDSTGRA